MGDAGSRECDVASKDDERNILVRSPLAGKPLPIHDMNQSPISLRCDALDQAIMERYLFPLRRRQTLIVFDNRLKFFV
jgi:hypothetical protein